MYSSSQKQQEKLFLVYGHHYNYQVSSMANFRQTYIYYIYI